MQVSGERDELRRKLEDVQTTHPLALTQLEQVKKGRRKRRSLFLARLGLSLRKKWAKSHGKGRKNHEG